MPIKKKKPTKAEQRKKYLKTVRSINTAAGKVIDPKGKKKSTQTKKLTIKGSKPERPTKMTTGGKRAGTGYTKTKKKR